MLKNVKTSLVVAASSLANAEQRFGTFEVSK